ncbi:MAG TPA: hypothetical protein VIJ85_01380 [Rhizomicrobium sp.]
MNANAAGSGASLVGKHGQTYASQQLQNDVRAELDGIMPILVKRATGDDQSIACGTVERIDTVVTLMDYPRRWSETWTYQVCDTQISIPIDFTPDGHGGAYFSAHSDGAIVGSAVRKN